MDRLETLEIIEAVKQLKARYLRALDMADWTLMEQVLSENAHCVFEGGVYTHEYHSRAEMIEFFRSAFHDQTITRHNCHHPEIEVLSSSSARGLWYLSDFFEHIEHNMVMDGSALYRDEYVLEEDGWRIKDTGYQRIYERMRPRDPEIQITAHYLASKPKS